MNKARQPVYAGEELRHKICEINVPGRREIMATSPMLTTTGRKSGHKFIFPPLC